MGVVGVIIEAPDFSTPANAAGPIVNVAIWSVRRENSKAGTWNATFPATEALADEVKTGWHVSIYEEGVDISPTNSTPWHLQRGLVNHHALVVSEAGDLMLELAGVTALGELGWKLLGVGAQYNDQLATIAADVIAGTDLNIAGTTPVTENNEVTFNEQTKLAILIKLAEINRVNMREIPRSGDD